MRLFAAATTALALAALAACTGGTPAAGGSPTPKASGGSAAPAATASTPVIVSTPTPAATPNLTPVQVKLTVDGKAATIVPQAVVKTVPLNESVFWDVGKLGQYTHNIGRGVNLLAEGECHVNILIKGPAGTQAEPRTLTKEEFEPAVNLVYKEGPAAWEWGANRNNYESGSFTVENGVITFKLVATMAGDKRGGNDGTPRKIDLEVSGLPFPPKKN